MLSAFIEYLKEQIGQPYLWGGQHTKLILIIAIIAFAVWAWRTK